MATAPNKVNYQIPTGRVYFTPTAGSIRELGNCTEFKLTVSVETKDHKRNYGGSRTIDATTVTSKGMKATFGLEEIVGANIALFAMDGSSSTDTDGNTVIGGLSDAQVTGTLLVVGDNDLGPKITWEGSVQIVPTGDFFLIKNDDEYNVINIEATVVADGSGNFGNWTVTEAT